MPKPLNTCRYTTRNAWIALGVMALHALGLWLLQSGQPAPDEASVIAASVVAELLPTQTALPAPAVPTAKTPPAPPHKATPVQTLAAPTRPALEQAAAVPQNSTTSAIAVPAQPTPQAPVAAQTPAPASGTANNATAALVPAQSKVELPSSSADYLNNPRPPYPPLSKRLNEQGKVVLRVLIETDGTASKAEIRTGSGYERLDQAALQTVLRWRYVPGKRNGVPEAMWFNVPINFVLE